MRKGFVFLCIVALLFGVLGSANANLIDFDVADAPDSSVTLYNVSSIGWTSISAYLVDGLGDTVFSLDDGESYTFDFFEISADGLGGGTAEISATLAFDQPVDSSNTDVTGNGSGGWFTIFGIITAGSLTWENMPQTVTLSNGNYFDVDFEDIEAFGLGDSTVVSATITAHAAPVPEPTTIVLSGIGLMGMGFFLRRRKSCRRKPSVSL